jgi:hypothetical protein
MDIYEKLGSEPNTPKWLVALTDGADNKSMAAHRNKIPDVLFFQKRVLRSKC